MITVKGKDVVVTNPSTNYYEVTIPLDRNEEIVQYINYVKGDESGVSITPVVKSKYIGDAEYLLSVPKTVIPMEKIGLSYLLNEAMAYRDAVPVSWRETTLILRIQFNDVGVGTEGTLDVALYPNQLR